MAKLKSTINKFCLKHLVATDVGKFYRVIEGNVVFPVHSVIYVSANTTGEGNDRRLQITNMSTNVTSKKGNISHKSSEEVTLEEITDISLINFKAI